MSDYDGQSLVNAQVSVNRAVFEHNMPHSDIAFCDHEPRSEYILQCVREAIEDLRKVEVSITGQKELFE